MRNISENFKILMMKIAEDYVQINGIWMKKSTGEVFDTEEDKDNARNAEYDSVILKDERDTEEKIKEICPDYEVGFKNKSKKSRKPKNATSGFNVSFREPLKEVMQLDLNYIERYVFLIIELNVDYPDNVLKIDGEIPTTDALVDFLKISNRPLVNALAKLEKYGLIKRVWNGHKKAIFLNPYFGGATARIDKVSTETLKLFEKITIKPQE